MSTTSEITTKLEEIRQHYEKYVNNKYVKNVFFKLDLSSTIKHHMNMLLVNDVVYLDTKGTLEDIYNGIKAVSVFIREVREKVIPNIGQYIGSAGGLSGQASLTDNDRILAQMAAKNYPMNIKILADLVYQLLTLVIEFDNRHFSDNPAYKVIKDFDQVGKNLLEDQD